jgi:uncharacterized membrane protein YphA (DoxX/SURF4 family)
MAPGDHGRDQLRSVVATAVRLLLGAVFVTAAWTKATDFASFSRDLWLEYQLPRALSSPAFFLPAIELAIGLALLLGLHVRTAAKFATAALIVFSAAIVYGVLGGGLEDCGCLGEIVEVGPFPALLRNAVLALAAIWLARRAPEPATRWRRAKLWTVVVAACFASGLTGTSAFKPFVDRTTARVGQEFPAIDALLEQGVDVRNGRWVVFGFAAACSHCWDATHQVKSLVGSPRVGVVGITASDEALVERFRDELDPGFTIVQLDAAEFGHMQRDLPTTWLVQDGIVIDKRERGTYSAPALYWQLDGTANGQ